MGILLYVWQYVGFYGSSPLVITVCSTTYHQSKYREIDAIDKTIFVACCISVFGSFVMTVVVIGWLVQNCTKPRGLPLCTKVVLYFMVTLAMCAMVPFGYYLTLRVEEGNCTFGAKNDTELGVITGLSGVAVVCALMFWIMLICESCGNNREEDYRDEEKRTEPVLELP